MLNKIMDFFLGKHASAVDIVGKRILVIDDGAVERRFISRSLEKRGYDVSTAKDGQDGLKAAQEEKPDLIVLDYHMPGLDGVEVCKKLKADKAQTRDIPVVFLTGSKSPASVVDCYDVGAEYYLSKPISARTLVNEVDMVFQEMENRKE